MKVTPTGCGHDSAVQQMRRQVLEPRRKHGSAFTEVPGMQGQAGKRQ